MERPWPLTGREDELRRVAAALRPGAAGIVVAGPPGVGKTRLAREAVASRAASGAGTPHPVAPVAWAHGSAAARTIPLGAFAGVLQAPDGEPVETVAAALALLARRPPRVLAVDDAHLLDEHSAIVLHRTVVRRLAPVVVTLRTGEATPDPVTALWKDEHLPRLDLTALDATGTAALVARVLAGPVESATTQRLWRLTRGVPLFLRHLLAGEVAAGRLSPATGIWRWTSAPTLTPELSDLLEHEIGALAAGVRDVVDLVALAEPVAVTTLGELTSPADVEVAEERGLVRVEGSVARLAHPLYGEVRREAMGTLRARRLRGQVARTLPSSPDPIPRAVLTLDSDLPEEPELFLRAAEAATRMFDLPLAERLARAAAGTGHPAARLVHAAALSWLSRGEEAEAILLDLAEHAPDPATSAFAHLHRTGNLLWTLARPVEAEQAMAAARATGAMPLHVAAMSVALAGARGDLDTVMAGAPELLRADLPDDLAGILVATAATAAAAVTGDRALLDEAAEVGGFRADGVPTVVPGFGLADFQVLGHRLAGSPGEVTDRVTRLRTTSADLPAPARPMGMVVAGHAALAEGRVADALTLLREAWADLAATTHEFRFRCRTLLALAWGQAGRADAAAPLAAALADPLTGQHPAWRLYAPDDLLARAWGAAAAGSTTRAVAYALAAGDLARGTGSRAYEVLALQTAVQLGEVAATLPRLRDLADVCLRGRLALAHATALASEDAAALLTAADEWERAGDLVAAGDAAAQSATLHRQGGRTGSGLRAATRAAQLATRSGACTPALLAAARPLPLTTREREVVTLAARGWSNRAIAEHLTVSVRTVEGHLYRAGHKLGVSDRTELAALLGIEQPRIEPPEIE